MHCMVNVICKCYDIIIILIFFLPDKMGEAKTSALFLVGFAEVYRTQGVVVFIFFKQRN